MRQRRPIFLARTGYRLRRLMDAARILPVAGAFLFLLPLLWGGGITRSGIIFIFGVWFGLIVVAATVAVPLGGQLGLTRDGGEDGGEDGSV